MYVKIEKITPDRQDIEFFEGYEWQTPFETSKAFYEAKERFSVPFEKADFLVDLYADNDDNLDTFPMSQAGYGQLPK